jgi:hypothetical protein
MGFWKDGDTRSNRESWVEDGAVRIKAPTEADAEGRGCGCRVHPWIRIHNPAPSVGVLMSVRRLGVADPFLTVLGCGDSSQLGKILELLYSASSLDLDRSVIENRK